MWEQTLSGLIKALRASKDDEKRVIQHALSEINQEVKSTDLELKAGAILKLSYLDMLGYPQLSSYSFNVIECMSSSKFHIKQIGYLAATQSFGPNTEVAMLATNLVKKDLASHSNFQTSFFKLSQGTSNPSPTLSLALSSLPQLLNTQNATDLTPDLLSILTHSKPIIRKRAVTVMYTLARLDLTQLLEEEKESGRDPQMQSNNPHLIARMETWVERFREKLLDDDIGVAGAAVSVICELVSKYPWPWLEVAAELYDLLMLKNNNWMMIKIVKLFTALTPIEPRLTKKLLPALSDIISTTSAMSLLYECIHTILAGGLLTHAVTTSESHNLATICIQKLAYFLDHADQNLRYIALVGLTKLLSSHAYLLEDHLDTILRLVSDPDPMLSARALELIEGITYSTLTLQSTADYLLASLQDQEPSGSGGAVAALQAVIRSNSNASIEPPTLVFARKIQTIHVMLTISSSQGYSNIPDFNWYLDLLIQLIHIFLSIQTQGRLQASSTPMFHSGKPTAQRLSETLVDVCSRVRDIRPYAVAQMMSLLNDDVLLIHTSNSLNSTSMLSSGLDYDDRIALSGLVTSAIWICGEYSEAESVDLKEVISTLFKRELVVDHSRTFPQVSTFALHNGLKVFVKWLRVIMTGWYSTEIHAQDDESEDEPESDQTKSLTESSSTAKQKPDKRRAIELLQLKRLTRAIIDRAQELVEHKYGPDSLNGIDRTDLIDRAHEVKAIMDYIDVELKAYQPPTPSSFRPARSTNLSQPNPDEGSYTFGSFGEANPFAMQSQSPHDGFHQEFNDYRPITDVAIAELEVKLPEPPLWYSMLSEMFFMYELKPVAVEAQSMIQAPEELDLDSWVSHFKSGVETLESGSNVDGFGRRIGDLSRESSEFTTEDIVGSDHLGRESLKKKKKRTKDKGVQNQPEDDQQATEKAKAQRLESRKGDPYYIISPKNRSSKTPTTSLLDTDFPADTDIDSIPIVKLDLSDSGLELPKSRSQEGRLTPQTRPLTPQRRVLRSPQIDTQGELPDLGYLKKNSKSLVGSKTSSLSRTLEPSGSSLDARMEGRLQVEGSVQAVKKKKVVSSKKKKKT